MKKLLIPFAVVFVTTLALGQDINVTFTGQGVSSQIDSIKATNLTKYQSITFHGNGTLVLTGNTGTGTATKLANKGLVYPNPCSGKATLTASFESTQNVSVQIENLVGQVLVQANVLAQPGENEFALSIGSEGIYLVSLKTELRSFCFKVICTEESESDNSINYLGATSYGQIRPNNPALFGLKNSQTSYSLGYSVGDVIQYICYSGIYTTILTDSPTASKNYEVEFSSCSDIDGKSYSIVKIGTQTWMAENLAYLPSVSPPSSGSDTSSFYYVYGYEGSSVSAAKGTTNYTTYGVLYNWEAAKTACPSGWHLPTDAEWKILEKHLGMSETDANSTLWRNSGTVGCKLKESGTIHWTSPNTGATNTSGFTALPGGDRFTDGGFNGLGFYADFWSSSEYGSSIAWSRILLNRYDGVDRYNLYRGNGFSVRCLQNSSGENTHPTASIAIQPESGSMATIFEFDASGCTDNETSTNQLQVRWDFENDGTWDTNYSTTKTASHQYPQAGTYTILLEVKDAGGLVDTEMKQVTVTTGGDGYFDYEGRRYNYKTIGTQTWMIENLAYLPSVSPSSSGSDTSHYYYVYGYEGSSVTAAKGTSNYATYGVLYNWRAAIRACPSGWHLPTDAEWTTLMDYLTNNGYGYGGSGSDIGKSMAFTSGWTSHSTAGRIGNDQGSNNRSEFTALPGGFRSYAGGFYGLGDYARFWSKSSEYVSDAWYRDLYYGGDGVYRGSDDRRGGFSVRCIKNE